MRRNSYHAAAKSLQSCMTLCNPTDGSPPGSPVSGILQARTLEWVAISFSSGWKWKVKVKSLSCIQLLATPGIAVYKAPLPMGFCRQEYWSGLPLPSNSYHDSLYLLTAYHLPGSKDFTCTNSFGFHKTLGSIIPILQIRKLRQK